MFIGKDFCIGKLFNSRDNMFYIGTAGVPISSKGRSTEDGIKRIAELGLNVMEVEFVRGVRMSLDTAKKVKELAESLDVKLSAHAPYYINLNSQKEETIEKSKVNIIKTAELANAMGAEVIVVHAGFYSSKSSSEATQIIAHGVKECAEQVKDKGWNVWIGLETMGKSGTWGTLDEIGEVCKIVSNVIPVVDFAHVHARDQGCLKSIKDFDELLRKYEDIFDKFLHSHFTCVNYGPKGERNHLTMEESKEPDFEMLAPVLRKKRYDITIISESPILETDALMMKEIIGL
jgi:deoxyribonuclease-4